MTNLPSGPGGRVGGALQGIALLLALTLGLAACGQTGPLYQPSEAPEDTEESGAP